VLLRRVTAVAESVGSSDNDAVTASATFDLPSDELCTASFLNLSVIGCGSRPRDLMGGVNWSVYEATS